MADRKIHEVHTGMAGSHIRSFNSSGMVAIKEKGGLALDVERVIEVARAMPIPAEQQILHIPPRSSSSTARAACASRSA